ncbi:MAG: hypothetical protein ACE5I7_09530 [Candidatus Binatia bacterium]
MVKLLRARTVHLMLGALCCLLPVRAGAGSPPEQKLPSALLVYPLIEVPGTCQDDSSVTCSSDSDCAPSPGGPCIQSGDTRVELVNLSGHGVLAQCFYVNGEGCNEVGFLISLTPYQPLSWLASAGLSNTLTGSAAPPFFGTGELKCAVVPPQSQPQIQFHNTIQGRATVFRSDGRTVSYGAVGFRRLSDGNFTGVLALDGKTYAQCPSKLHFDVLADQPGATSEMVLLPCSQDLLFQEPTSVTVQLLIINEFEETFSTSLRFTCFDQRALGDIADSLVRSTLGTDTAQVIVRGVGEPLLGLVVDAVPAAGTAGNEPSFQGGRPATVIFP